MLWWFSIAQHVWLEQISSFLQEQCAVAAEPALQVSIALKFRLHPAAHSAHLTCFLSCSPTFLPLHHICWRSTSMWTRFFSQILHIQEFPSFFIMQIYCKLIIGLTQFLKPTLDSTFLRVMRNFKATVQLIVQKTKLRTFIYVTSPFGLQCGNDFFCFIFVCKKHQLLNSSCECI